MDDVKLTEQGRSPNRRAYRMRRRAEHVDQTRLRITEAAVRLHTSIGPSATSLSAVAEEAGVTRLTLSRHFGSKDELFGACMAHWRALHPPPDPASWRGIEPFDDRLRTALRELYAWYQANDGDLYPIYRDASFTPTSNQRARRANTERMVDAILADETHPPARRRRLRAALGHVVGFLTWRSLTTEEGLSTEQAGAMATRFVLAAIDI